MALTAAARRAITCPAANSDGHEFRAFDDGGSPNIVFYCVRCLYIHGRSFGAAREYTVMMHDAAEEREHPTGTQELVDGPAGAVPVVGVALPEDSND